jgi:hypothetical protein
MVLLMVLCGPAWGAWEGTGTNGYIVVSNIGNYTPNLSFALWFYHDSNGDILLSKEDTGGVLDYQLYLHTDNKLRWQISGRTVWTADTLDASTWYHVVCTYGGGTATVYINGSVNGTPDSGGGAVGNDATDLGIGCRGFDGGYKWDGKITDVSMYSAELSAAEVSLLYNARLARLPLQFSSLVRYWPLDDGPAGTSANGDTVYDLVAAKNGTSTDGTWRGNILTIARFFSAPFWRRSGSAAKHG